MKLTVREDVFPIAGGFTISRGTRTESRVVTVSLEKDGITGRAECYPYARYDETVESVIAQIEAMGGFRMDAPFDHVFGTKHALIDRQRAMFLADLNRAQAAAGVAEAAHA